MEIQRLVGRSLRQAVDLQAMGERQLTLDCDVLNADGGTRCAAITGAWVALALALRARGLDAALVRQVAAVSVGILPDAPDPELPLRLGMALDLEYEEDHRAAVDCNLVAARPATLPDASLDLVEFQSTGEGRTFTRAEALDPGGPGAGRLPGADDGPARRAGMRGQGSGLPAAALILTSALVLASGAPAPGPAAALQAENL